MGVVERCASWCTDDGSTDSLGLVKFEHKVIRERNTLVEEVEVLQRTANDENATHEGVEKALVLVKYSVAASDWLTAKFTESENAWRLCAWRWYCRNNK